MKQKLIVIAVGVVLGTASVLNGQIISQPVAQKYGLVRQWFTQVPMNTARDRVRHITIDRGVLFVQTDGATLSAIDAETGATLWSTKVGNARHPSMKPAASELFVATINGSWIYVLDRRTGRIIWRRMCHGAPGAGPALTDEFVYVPTVDGKMYAYKLRPALTPAERLALMRQIEAEGESAGQTVAPSPETPAAASGQPGTSAAEQTPQAEVAQQQSSERIELRMEERALRPLVCQSYGRIMTPPAVARRTAGDEYVAWVTDRGYMFVGFIRLLYQDRFSLAYQLVTEGQIAATPAYLPPDPDAKRYSGIIYCASTDGFVYAIDERDGSLLWRFSTGEPIHEAVTVIDLESLELYVPTRAAELYCLDAVKGTLKWRCDGPTQFVAASTKKVYAVDPLERLCILDRATGQILDSIYVYHWPIRVRNEETDRIYLCTADGVLQCLREKDLEEPLVHKKHTTPASPRVTKPQPQAATEQSESSQQHQANPFQ